MERLSAWPAFDSLLQVNVDWAVYFLISLCFAYSLLCHYTKRRSQLLKMMTCFKRVGHLIYGGARIVGRAWVAQRDNRSTGCRDIRSYCFMFFVNQKM